MDESLGRDQGLVAANHETDLADAYASQKRARILTEMAGGVCEPALM
ncbi:hypothetical protein [Pseudomonas sp. PA15(2017)]|nr:hypothetical protein [Pseudomonas sp. PA15(2017)]